MYEISIGLDGFYYSYCSKSMLFNKCKERAEIKILFSDKTRLEQLRKAGFKLMVPKNP